MAVGCWLIVEADDELPDQAEEMTEENELEQQEQKDKTWKHQKKEKTRPQWSYDNLYRHEIKLELCDP
ncbi:MAG: hypothetical protein J6P54_06735 [Bacteroidales bacterium]|nr:hypothetical protein [Bacteroidales bacterium]